MKNPGHKLYDRFHKLINDYDAYSRYLLKKKSVFKEEAHRTTEIVEEVLNEN